MFETKSYDFVFLRHGESVGNVEERLQGQSDYELTDRGRQQVRDLAERWRRDGERFDLIITSPLARAKETARIIADALKAPVEEDPIWLERDVGDLTGYTREETLEKYPSAEQRMPYDPFGESGEGDWQLYLRAGTAVHQLLKRPPGRYLIVTHGGLLNKLMYAMLGIPIQPHSHGASFRFGNTGYAMFSYLPGRHQWRMLRLVSPD